MRVAIITTVYAGYDPIRRLPDGHGFDDAVCVTDDPSLTVEGWRMVVRAGTGDPRFDGKAAKMEPWRFTDCDAAIFIDASIEIVDPGFSQVCRDILTGNDLVIWSHPEGRTCLRQEAEVCQDWPKYAVYDIRGQVQHYSNAGMPQGWGLFACGVIGWRFTDKSKEFGTMWLQENREWSCQDQVSLPFLLWREGKRFAVWPAHQYQNPWFRIRWDERPGGQGPSAPQ